MGLRLDRKTDEKVEFYLVSLFLLSTTSSNPADIYLFKGNQRISKKKCAICSKLTIKTPERRY